MTDLPGYPSRRSFLKASAASVMLSGLAVSAKAEPQTPPVPLEEYERQYFNEVEWAFILAATARLIPSEGDGPGAIEARVPVFIDLQLAGDFGRADDWYMVGPHDPSADPTRGWQTPLNPAQIYRQGIPAFNAWCEQKHGAAFAALTAEQQDAALTSLQKGEVGLQPELRDFCRTPRKAISPIRCMAAIMACRPGAISVSPVRAAATRNGSNATMFAIR
jgi:gluconate 2-dehydrogenase gamma chain